MPLNKPSTYLGTTVISAIIWAISLTSALLFAMFKTTVGRTTALFGSVYFQATEGRTETDLSFGIASASHALAVFAVIWLIVFVASLLLAKLKRPSQPNQ